jgi:AmmeMemoRadiSam system protein B
MSRRGGVRPSLVAGTWYPADRVALAREVDRRLEAAGPAGGAAFAGQLVAIAAPHAGLRYSGPTAAYAYRLIDPTAFDVAVLVGPSHRVDFIGAAVDPHDAFETPLGPAPIDRACADALVRCGRRIVYDDGPHAPEHSLEMQLPFLQRVAPSLPIVPVVMGRQTPEAISDVAEAVAAATEGMRALLVASTDLSHYHPAPTAATLDGEVLERTARFDVDGLADLLRCEPAHACGGGPLVAVMRCARAKGATSAAVLHYSDSGDVTGDKSAVVGYMAAAFSQRPHERSAR